METTTIIIIAVVLILLVIAGIMMTRPKTEAEVDADLTKEVSKAETKLEEKTAELQDANKKLAAEPTPKKAAEVVKKAEEVKEAAAKVEEKKTEKAVVQAQKINCKVGDWGEYSQCELVNGVWKKKKTRKILEQPSGGGDACPSDLEMSEVCKTVKGRYVSLGFVNEYKGTINIWQMDVFDKDNNLISQGKPVTGLNILPQFPGSKLVDNTRYTEDDNQLIHTAGTSPNEYVEIDLGAEYDISRIVVYNRTNCCWDRIKGARIIISTSPARNNPVYTSEELTNFRIQWVYPPYSKVIGDNDLGYGDRPRGFYNIYGDENKKYVRCREVGDNPRFIACATEDDMYLKEYNGKSIKDILGNLYNSPSNFIRMRRQEVAKGDTF